MLIHRWPLLLSIFPGPGQDVRACVGRILGQNVTLQTILLERPHVLPALYWTMCPHWRDKLQIPLIDQVRADAVFEEW